MKPKKAVFKVTVEVPEGVLVKEVQGIISDHLYSAGVFVGGRDGVHIDLGAKVTRYRPSRNERTKKKAKRK